MRNFWKDANVTTTRPTLEASGGSNLKEFLGSTAGLWAKLAQGDAHQARRTDSRSEAAPAMLHTIDPDGHLVSVSDFWLVKTGYTRPEVIGRSVTDFLAPARREHVVPTRRLELSGLGRVTDVECQLVCKDGTTIDVLVAVVKLRDARGQTLLMSVLQDVTERNHAHAALVSEHERLRVALDSIEEGAILLDRTGNVEYLNPVAEKLTGWSNLEAQRLPVEEVFRLTDDAKRPGATIALPSAVPPRDDIDASLKLRARGGQEYYIDRRVAQVNDATGSRTGAILAFRDVSARVSLHREMLYRATHDALTGILDRREFERHLHAAVDGAREYGWRCATLYIDLHRLKLVNDTGGHAAGDRLLKEVASIIGSLIHDGDTFARLGGGEFGLLIRPSRVADAQGLAERICHELDAFRFCEGNLQFHIGASIGVVLFDRCWATAGSVLRAAESACQAAKAAGRNRVHTYNASDEAIESHHRDIEWVRRIEEALDNGKFTLHWQRIVPLGVKRNSLHGEVLLRMLDGDGKLILPGLFLPSAERYQMATRIDRWVVREVFELMETHKRDSANLATVAVNLSGQSIGDRSFHLYVLDLMDRIDFDTRKVCFEITETAMITNISDASAFFASMRSRGVRFALDDFGSGVSSFGYLKVLPVDYLKIDGQFVKGLADDPVAQATVRCLGEIARITGKQAIAEFVETEAAKQMLHQIGIDYAQGYLLHRPSPIVSMFEAARGSMRHDSG